MKIAILLLAGDDVHADEARLTNAVGLAKEANEAGDDFRLIFDGAGTVWVPQLADGDHPYSDLFDELMGKSEACQLCAGAFEVEAKIRATEVPLVGDHDGHPSLRRYLSEGYQIVTF